MAAPRQPWPGFTWGARSYLMGILNVTPDSFSDGGRFLEPTAALAQARQMAAEGADLLDIGAESTRPGAEPVSTDDEWARLESVLTALEADPDTPPVSLDTTKAPVAEKAFSGGLACVLNDVHGLLGDPALADVAAQYQVGVIVMHNARLRPASGDIVEAAKRYFDEALGVADRAGISGNALVLDPGIGFGLTPQQSLTLLQRIGELRIFGLPLLLGASRKSVLGYLLGDASPDERLEATLATTALGVAAGVDVFRVHDVRANRRAAMVADAICRVHDRG